VAYSQVGSDEAEGYTWGLVDVFAEGNQLKLQANDCFGWSANPAGDNGWSWQLPGWVQTLASGVPVVRNLTYTGDLASNHSWHRESVRTALGYDESQCTSGTCTSYDMGGGDTFQLPNRDLGPSNPPSPLFVDHDGSGLRGIEAVGPQAATDGDAINPLTGTGDLSLLLAISAKNSMDINMGGWSPSGTSASYPFGKFIDEDSRNNFVGCANTTLCGFVPNNAITACHEDNNTVQWIPVADSFSCGEMLGGGYYSGGDWDNIRNATMNIATRSDGNVQFDPSLDVGHPGTGTSCTNQP
jgi:hypothetical protein